jgi:DNA replication protein DnaC
MMSLSEIWHHFRLLSTPDSFTQNEQDLLQRFFSQEYHLRERKKIEYLMKRSGIKRMKLLDDFDWKFNPKIPRDKIMEYMNTVWLKSPSNLVIIGPAGVGKSHIGIALCHDALMRGYQTTFLTLYDLTLKLSKAKSVFSLVEYYSKVPILCLDELGYVFPTKEQADCIFQIISKRGEIATTIVTTNLIPSNWGKIFDSVTATAILDRLSMNGTFITFEGRSYRNRRGKD